MTSSADKSAARSNFAGLSEAECKELLEQHSADRIGFMAPDGPQILPVTYQHLNGSIVFRTSPAGSSSRQLPDPEAGRRHGGRTCGARV
jgi:nitroimidazol reductase NimA-like FMN-containing flavoprotein (pyridoxamine 5'-phosphate oxidase superfamily)